MLINYCRLAMLAYLMIANILVAADTEETVKISFIFDDTEETFFLPKDTIGMFKTIADVLKDLGVYKGQIEHPIPLSICASVFHQIINVLYAARQSLFANEMHKRKIILTTYNMDQADQKELQDTVEKIMPWLKMSSDDLLDVIEAANYLDVPVIVHAGAKIWAQQYSMTKSRFNVLNDDIKAVIIKELTPRRFLTLMHANASESMSSKQTADQEGAFRIALRIHYDIKEPPEGFTAKAHYEELNCFGRFVAIPGGTYEIGSPVTEANREMNEKLHFITLSPFVIMDAAVTQKFYATITGTNPSYFNKKTYCPESFEIIEVNGVEISVLAEHPVERVSWYDANKFAERLTAQDPKYTYSIPTEAQLEVAFRGGTTTAYVTGRDDKAGLGDYVWYIANSNRQTHPVKSKYANAFKIHRSSVREWTADYYDKDYLGSTSLDPEGSTLVSKRVIRGGGWGSYGYSSRSALRYGGSPNYNGSNDLGFRLVRTVK